MVRSYMDRGKKAWEIQRCAAVNGTCRIGLGRAPTFGCTTLVVAKQQLGRFGWTALPCVVGNAAWQPAECPRGCCVARGEMILDPPTPCLLLVLIEASANNIPACVGLYGGGDWRKRSVDAILIIRPSISKGVRSLTVKAA
jgi:hypothetical protein